MQINLTIRPVANYSRGEITGDILCLAAGADKDCITIAPTQKKAPRISVIHIIDTFEPRNQTERNRVWKALKYLEERDRLALYERAGERFVSLTDYGLEALEELYISNLKLKKPKKWDGKWRLVMFDIPLEYEVARVPIRQKLGDFGFATYQKSIFIHPYPCTKEVREVAKFFGVEDFVMFAHATNISKEDKFKKLFDLK